MSDQNLDSQIQSNSRPTSAVAHAMLTKGE
jgi:hypothetical protein